MKKNLQVFLCAVLTLFLFLSPFSQTEIIYAADTNPIVKLDPSKIQKSNLQDIVVCPEKNGVFFIQNDPNTSDASQVLFYSLSDGSYTNVFSASDLLATYVSDTGFHCLTEKYSWNESSGKYDYILTFFSYTFRTGNVYFVDLPDVFRTKNWHYQNNPLGVDDSGRIYIFAFDTLYVYSHDGKEIAHKSLDGDIISFCGFDPSNGDFYYEGGLNWEYWGYDHYMSTLMGGNLSGSTLTVKEKSLCFLYQSAFFKHQRPVQMLGNSKLAVLSIFNNGLLSILDSSGYLAGSINVSSVNLTNARAILFECNSLPYEADPFYGPHCSLGDNGDSLIVLTEKKELTEYSLSRNARIFSVKTQYEPVTFCYSGKRCMVLEKNGSDFYLETIDWSYPTSLVLKADPMTVGTSQQLKLVGFENYDMDYDFSSSDNTIVSVDDEGKLNAWKKGKAVITAEILVLNLRATIEITVTDSALSASKDIYKATTLTGLKSTNIHLPNNGGYFGSIINSYLVPISGGGYWRVENTGNEILLEKYSASLKKLSTKKLKKELPVFGGFYAGSQYNFFVFGAVNNSEKDDKEVIRVVKYDKNFNRISGCAIKKINTTVPFDAGNVDMTEANGILFIHTCHEMYRSSDGYNHQANMTFAITQSTMQIRDSFSDVSNLSEGYVSHSFAQFIRSDGSNIYRVDLGDAYPRGIAYSMTPVNSPLDSPSLYGTLMEISGNTGNNYTGFNLSGLELSDNYSLIAGSGYKNSSASSGKNVFLLTVNQSTGSVECHWITSYDASSGIVVGAPRFVKTGSNSFLFMWEERKSTSSYYTTKMVTVAGNGEVTSKVLSSPLHLSECQPVVNTDGLVAWYVTDNGAPSIIEINPQRLDQVSAQSKKDEVYLLPKGQTFSVGNLKYKVTKSDAKSGTVTFYGLKKTTDLNVTIPDTVKYKNITYKVTAISASSFSGNTTVMNVSIGKNVTTIGEKAFYKCSRLKQVTGCSAVTSLGNYCFAEAKQLVQVGAALNTVKLSKLTEIKKSAFKNCTALKTVNLTGSGLTKIEADAFYGCKALKTLSISSTKLTTIGSRAFYQDKALTKITFYTKKLKSSSIGANAFTGVYAKCTYTVPKDMKTAYQKLFLSKGAANTLVMKTL